MNVCQSEVRFVLQLPDNIYVMALFSSDVLALPIFKQEESNLPSETENKILPFQYVLCAATSPAVKLHDETLTYLNQGQYQNPRHFSTLPSLSRSEDAQSKATERKFSCDLCSRR